MSEYDLGSAVLGTAVDLAGITKGIADAQSTAEGGFSGIGNILSGALKVGLAGAVIGFGAVSVAIGKGVEDARAAKMEFAQTEQVIKSTGGAAGVSAQEVADYAKSLDAASGKSLFSKTQIQDSSNLLLTFTNVKGEILKGATAISVDMAQALGGAPKDAAIQLGKALNDPIKGVSALSRVGVTFDAQQKKQIETMVKSGNVAGAQGVILKELNKEFGGQAAAAAAADGGWAQFNGRMQEAAEGIGTALLPAMNMLADLANNTIAPAIENISAYIAGMSDAFSTGSNFAEGFERAIYSLEGVSPVFVTIGDAVKRTFDTFDKGFASNGIVGGIGQLLYSLDGFNDEFDGIADSLGYLFDTLNDTVGGMVASVQAHMDDLRGAIEYAASAFMDVFGPIFDVAASVISDVLLPVLGQLFDWFMTSLPTAITMLAQFWSTVLAPVFDALADLWFLTLLPAFKDLGNWFQVVIPAAGAVLVGVWYDDILPAMQTVSAFIVDTVIPSIAQIVTWLEANLPGAIATASSFWSSTLQPALETFGTFITSTVIPAIGQLVQWLQANLPGAVQAAAGFWSSTLQPALEAVGAYITGTVIPAIGQLALWLQANLPGAIAALVGFWNGTLWPALQAVGSFIAGTLIPTLASLISGGIQLVSAAVQGLAAFWTGTLQPALAVVGSFISGTLIPVLGTLISGGISLVQGAVQALAAVWTGILQPALAAVGGFISGTIYPLLSSLVTLYLKVCELAVVALAAVWTTILQPALSAVGGYISATLQPIFAALSSFFTSTIQPAITTLINSGWKLLQEAMAAIGAAWTSNVQPALNAAASFLSGTLKSAIDGAKSGFDAVKGAIDYVISAIKTLINWADTLIQKLEDLKAKQEAITGHGPPPLAVAFDYMGESVRNTTNDIQAATDAADDFSKTVLKLKGDDQKKAMQEIRDGFASITEKAKEFVKTIQGDALSGAISLTREKMKADDDLDSLFGTADVDAIKKKMDDLRATETTAQQKADDQYGKDKLAAYNDYLSQKKALDDKIASTTADVASGKAQQSDLDALQSQLANLEPTYNRVLTSIANAYNLDKQQRDSQLASDLASQQQLYNDAIQKQGYLNSIADEARQSLNEAAKQADQLATTDPKAAAQYFDLRKDQIVELAKLDQQISEAKDADEVADLTRKKQLTEQAQAEEIQQFNFDLANRTQDRQDQVNAINDQNTQLQQMQLSSDQIAALTNLNNSILNLTENFQQNTQAYTNLVNSNANVGTFGGSRVGSSSSGSGISYASLSTSGYTPSTATLKPGTSTLAATDGTITVVVDGRNSGFLEDMIDVRVDGKLKSYAQGQSLLNRTR